MHILIIFESHTHSHFANSIDWIYGLWKTLSACAIYTCDSNGRCFTRISNGGIDKRTLHLKPIEIFAWDECRENLHNKVKYLTNYHDPKHLTLASNIKGLLKYSIDTPTIVIQDTQMWQSMRSTLRFSAIHSYCIKWLIRIYRKFSRIQKRDIYCDSEDFVNRMCRLPNAKRAFKHNWQLQLKCDVNNKIW